MAAKQKRKARAAPDDKAQSERFKKTARGLGVDNDESAKAFERAFSKLIPPRLTHPIAKKGNS